MIHIAIDIPDNDTKIARVLEQTNEGDLTMIPSKYTKARIRNRTDAELLDRIDHITRLEQIHDYGSLGNKLTSERINCRDELERRGLRNTGTTVAATTSRLLPRRE